MRDNLINKIGQEITLYGNYIKFGERLVETSKKNYNSKYEIHNTFLIKNVMDENENYICDHLWIDTYGFFNYDTIKKNKKEYKENDIIKIKGICCIYYQNDCVNNILKYGIKYKTDIGIKKIISIEKRA